MLSLSKKYDKQVGKASDRLRAQVEEEKALKLREIENMADTRVQINEQKYEEKVGILFQFMATTPHTSVVHGM